MGSILDEGLVTLVSEAIFIKILEMDVLLCINMGLTTFMLEFVLSIIDLNLCRFHCTLVSVGNR
jgi:hypothetical protein